MTNEMHKLGGFLHVPVLVILGIVVLLGGVGVVLVEQNNIKAGDNSVLVSEKSEDKESATSTSMTEIATTETILASEESGKDTAINKVEEKKEEIPQKIELTLPESPEKNTIEKKLADPDISPLVGPFTFNHAWRDAVVNLICKNGKYGKILTTGTGVVIDPRGVIITNAHVASDWLFTEKWSPFINPYVCSVRTGLKANGPAYEAEVLYIARDRILSEATEISDQSDDGYEKYAPKDYALLVVTDTGDPDMALPATFSYIPPYTGSIPQIGSSLYSIGYPARFTDTGINFRMFASPLVVKETRTIVGTSGKNIVAFQGVIAAQHGSSGGAIVNNQGQLVAIPTFFDKLRDCQVEEVIKGECSSIGKTSEEGVMNAITIKYVSDDLKKDIGLTLEEFVSRGNPKELANEFMETHTPEYHCIYSNANRKYHNAPPFQECAEWAE